MKVWVCQVRKEVFVGGESQRCRHTISPTESPSQTSGSAFSQLGCGEMELIGGEPLEWCVAHDAVLCCQDCGVCRHFDDTVVWASPPESRESEPCQFESQIRVGP